MQRLPNLQPPCGTHQKVPQLAPSSMALTQTPFSFGRSLRQLRPKAQATSKFSTTPHGSPSFATVRGAQVFVAASQRLSALPIRVRLLPCRPAQGRAPSLPHLESTLPTNRRHLRRLSQPRRGPRFREAFSTVKRCRYQNRLILPQRVQCEPQVL